MYRCVLCSCRVNFGPALRQSRSLTTSTRVASGNNPFPVIRSGCIPPDSSTAKNVEVNTSLFEHVREMRAEVLATGRKVASTDRAGRKLTARERIELLKDEGTELLEIATFAGLRMPYGKIYNAVTTVAIATIAGELCVISANDWAFKGGTSYPISVKKQLRVQEMSLENRLPCIYLVDSGGAFLPLQADVFPDKNHGGRVFRNQAVLSSMGIPQLAVVLGPCTAGGAYIPTMCDEAVIVKGIGTLYLGGPPLVKAATGEIIGQEELGGADVHCGISGCTDHWAGSEEEAFEITRRVVASLNLPRNSRRNCIDPEPPLYPCAEEDFARLIPPTGFQDWPTTEIIARLVDGSRFHSFKEKYGPTLLTGFARINGHLVGLLASDGELTAKAALKGAHFIRLCSIRDIPLVFLQNTPSDDQFLSRTGNDGLTAKARGQMVSTLACSTVPKITVVIGGSYGPSSYAMCGRAMQPNFLFAWPHAKVAVAEPGHILKAMEEQEERGEPSEQLLEVLHSDESVHPSSNLLNDGVILPQETRQVLAQCLEVCLAYQRPSSLDTDGHRLSVLRM